MKIVKKIVFSSVISFLLLLEVTYSQPNPPDFKKLAEEAHNETENYNQIVDEYNSWALKHTKKVYTAQYIKSNMIFIAVLIIMFAGLYFSFIQFKHSVSKDFKLPDSEIKTNLKVSINSIEITSSIIGLIILIISLIFFYLYLKEVYPIRILPSSWTHYQEDKKAE